MSGKLYRNSADQNGSVPYIVLDRWGVVRAYVAPAQGVELESCIGQQVSLQGTIKTLPGGDMPYMTCQHVLSGNAELTGLHLQHHPAAVRRESIAPVVQDQPARGIAPQPGLPTRSDMAADPAPRTAELSLREVVLEPQTLPVADDSQDRPNPPAARRADPRRLRHSAVQSANYQEETLPTPIPSGELHRSPMAVSPTLEPDPMEDGPMVSQGTIVRHGHAVCDACNEGPCDACCDDVCPEPCWGPRRPLFCVGPTGIWAKADYLQWWEQGMHVPALVTTGPSTDQPGIIGQPGTTVLFGDDNINDKSVSGGRLQAGLWLNACATIGLEGEFFGLGDEVTNYYRWSDGNPILSRPYNDVNPNNLGEQVQYVAFPRGSVYSVDGAILINTNTRFHGAGAHFLFTTCRQEGCWTDDCGSCTTYHDRFRADFIAGYRYLDLEDQLGIWETLTSTSPPPVTPENPDAGSAFLVHDQFNTQNSFNGADLGMKFEFQRNRWSLDLFPRIALGSTHAVVDINGSTRVTNSTGVESTAAGGLLALPTNIGHYTQDNFAVVPELDVKIGFQFTTHTRLVVGYDGLYWSKVARAGDQIDTSVNSTLLPQAVANGITQQGPSRPQFTFQETGFWAQGVTLGIDCRW
ncbi:MAG: BBP7 family outer membrane beta-barrel protein [Thermoguttaceae bacterium]